MATSSLSKFTVPLSTNQSASTQGLLMPKLKYRFRVSFENFGVSQPVTELTKQVMDFTRPTVGFDPMEIPIYNSKVYLVGRPTWEVVTCTLRDDAGGNVSKLVGEQLQKQFDFAEQASAAAGIDYKFLTRFEVLDGGNGAIEPTVLETWELYGCFVSNANYGEANYNSNEPMTVAIQIRYDNALQIPSAANGAGGVGAQIAGLVTRNVLGAITG